MTKQQSFSKFENQVLHGFRDKINLSESSEDIKKFFNYAVKELFEHVFENKINVEFEDVQLVPDRKPFYTISERILASENFSETWKNSDLSRVVGRLAETAANHYLHIEKHPEKTDAKIRM